MKQRFSSLDVKVIAHELQESLVSLRLANIYDLSSKILLVKFAKPDNKKQLVIDIGFRCHLTEFARTTAAAPSVFVARLRKSLKTRRLTSVQQIGTDRILEFQFSDGQYRLFLEFFASGNIILTDADLNILAIAHTVPEGEGQEPQRVGLQYSLDNRQNYGGIPPLTKERVASALRTSIEKAAAIAPSAKAKKGKPGGDLRKCLAVTITEIPPVLVDSTLQKNGFDANAPLPDILANDALMDQLVEHLVEAREAVKAITSPAVCKGYIFAKRKPTAVDLDGEHVDEPKREDLLYDDFHPFVPQKIAKDPLIHVLEIDGYNQTVDEFFSSLEGQKLESRLAEREAIAQRRMQTAKQDQAKRIEGLQEVQELNYRKAAAIEANVERVQEAMDAVNGLIAQGMDWVDIGKLVEREKKRHNPVAETIKGLKLAENLITLMLAEEEFEEEQGEDDPFETDDDESETEANTSQKVKPAGKALAVDINLSLSPWSNAREYFDSRRTAAIKEEKTQLQSVRALKNTEKKINDDLKKGLKQEKALLQPIRKQMWFEKFTWFISSDRYLVIGGKDAQQNEILYKRYLRKGDVYCHADLRGAAMVIVKNNPSTPDAPIPPATLSQAGTLSVCTSEAWDSKAGMGAWWVNADQVSKSARAGEFLPVGSFNVRGNKNFLPPAQLLLGLGFMFKISEESKAKHVKHRVNDGNSAAGTSAQADEEVPVAADQLLNDDSGDEQVNLSDNDDLPQSDSEEGPRDNPLQDRSDGKDSQLDEVEQGLSDMDITKEQDGQDAAEKSEDEDADETEDAETPPESTDNTSVSSHPKNQPPKKAPAKRGRRAKAKKIANKYKDQDEEDRLAAEALIGARTGQDRAEAEAKAKEAREAELEFQKERRRAQHQKQQQETADHEEIRKIMMDEGVDLLDDGEADQAALLDDLIGTPMPGDEIIEVVPICAPWTALSKVKYKAKLQPGSTKKGKAVKEVLERLKIESGRKGVMDEQSRDTEKMWPREVELLKALKPEETVNVVPVGKVRVMMGGGGGGGGKTGAKGGGRGGRGRSKK